MSVNKIDKKLSRLHEYVASKGKNEFCCARNDVGTVWGTKEYLHLVSVTSSDCVKVFGKAPVESFEPFPCSADSRFEKKQSQTFPRFKQQHTMSRDVIQIHIMNRGKEENLFILNRLFRGSPRTISNILDFVSQSGLQGQLSLKDSAGLLAPINDPDETVDATDFYFELNSECGDRIYPSNGTEKQRARRESVKKTNLDWNLIVAGCNENTSPDSQAHEGPRVKFSTLLSLSPCHPGA